MKIRGSTRVISLFGYPVEHSLSPVMHNAAFEHLKLNYCYVAFSVKPELLKEAVKAIRALNLAGVNVTVPHKEKVIPFLDKVDKEASFIGAVNTIVSDNGRLIGYNTDGRGFMRSLSESHISVKNKNVLIIGAGGASRAISYYLSKEALGLFLFDIDKKKAGQLSRNLSKIRNNVFLRREIDHLDDMDIIINATPLGWKKGDPLSFDINLLKQRHIVCDLIYKNTNLLANASKKGCKTLNGLGMLLWQGVFAFELWTGIKPPVDVMKRALIRSL